MRSRIIQGSGVMRPDRTPSRPLSFRLRGPHDPRRSDCMYGKLSVSTDGGCVTGRKGKKSRASFSRLTTPYRKPRSRFRARQQLSPSGFAAAQTRRLSLRRVTHVTTPNALPSDHWRGTRSPPGQGTSS